MFTIAVNIIKFVVANAATVLRYIKDRLVIPLLVSFCIKSVYITVSVFF